MEYEVEAKEMKATGGSAYIHKGHYAVDAMTIQVHDLWLSQAHAHFEKLRVSVTKEAELHDLTAKGNELQVKSKDESVRVVDSTLETEKNKIKAKKEISVIHNQLRGEVSLEGGLDQTFSHNVIQPGSLTVMSRTGAADLHDNQFLMMDSVQVKAPQGPATLSHNTIQTRNFEGEAQHLSLDNDEIHSLGEVRLKGEKVTVNETSSEANMTRIEAVDDYTLHKMTIQSQQNVELSTQGTGAISESSIEGKKISTDGSQAITESTLHAEELIKMNQGALWLDKTT